MKARYNGNYGRFSVINALISGIIFVGVRYRLLYQGIRNKVKYLLKPVKYQIKNDPLVSETFKRFAEKGYEKINVGGGGVNLTGFINIDFVPHRNVEREVVANILDLSFIPDESLAHVHSNHVSEHLTERQLSGQLSEYHRILRYDGLLTIRCPNALGVCYGFWFDVVPETEHESFMALGYPPDEKFYNPLDGWYHKDFFGLLHYLHGDKGNVGNQHLSVITPSKLKLAVESSGFTISKMTDPETTNIVLVARKKKSQ
jgi:SAM-dependent methyltransferase